MNMRRIIISFLFLLPWFAAVFAQRPQDKKLVTVKAQRMHNNVRVNGVAITAHVGKVIIYHNGAIITCDSLLQYSNDHFEGFGNVIMNQDSIYIYGDSFDYRRNINSANVYSPIIKMMDGDAILYTYNFRFNTLDRIGEYYGGGTMARGNTLLESERGYYYAETRDVSATGNAELRDETYKIKSDSLGYNMNTEIVSFYRKTYIWNDKDEILSANLGWYYTKENRYHFTSYAYILTEDHEIWADDIDYNADTEDVFMRRDIQIKDDKEKAMAFGDYGYYLGASGNALLTENPSIISFEEGGADSLYMRADSIFLYVVDSTSIYSSRYNASRRNNGHGAVEEELISSGGTAASGRQDTGQMSLIPQSPAGGKDSILPEGMQRGEPQDGGIDMEGSAASAPARGETDGHEDGAEDTGPEAVEASAFEAQQTQADTEQKVKEPEKPLSKKELREQKKESKRQAKEAKKAAKEEQRKAKGAEKAAEKAERYESKDTGTPKSATDDKNAAGGTASDVVDGTPESADMAEMYADTPSGASVGTEAQEGEKEKVVVAYHNVKIFRNDFQAICDSLVAFSLDTTVHMHKNPVMWNGDNQITAELAVLYIRNEALDRAVFSGGTPIMASQVDRNRFNQVTGRTIEAFFRDGEMYRANVKDNAQTYYFIQDDKTKELQGFIVISAANITFIIVDRTVEKITYRVNPEFSVYPMDRIPSSQNQIFPDFKWLGDLRPLLGDVFNRTIRPSQREHYMKLPKPLFPKTQNINNRKKTLVSAGTWRDRSEDISAEAREAIRNFPQ